MKKGTWDFFYANATGHEKDLVSAAKRLEWAGMTAEEEEIVEQAKEVLAAYDLA